MLRQGDYTPAATNPNLASIPGRILHRNFSMQCLASAKSAGRMPRRSVLCPSPKRIVQEGGRVIAEAGISGGAAVPKGSRKGFRHACAAA